MKNIIKKIIKNPLLIITNNIIRVITGIILSIIGFSLSNQGILGELLSSKPGNSLDIWFWIGMIGVLLWAGTGLIFILYVWIYRPLKSIIDKWL